jgi:hypothetical protein
MEGTYEYELERAELLGVNPPDRAQWEVQNKARLEAEAEQEQTEVAQELESEGEGLKRTQGKMEELNNILNATQVKINKFKVSTKMVKFDTFFDEIFLFRPFAEVSRVCSKSAVQVQHRAMQQQHHHQTIKHHQMAELRQRPSTQLSTISKR